MLEGQNEVKHVFYLQSDQNKNYIIGRLLLLYIADITNTPRLQIVYKTLFSVYTRAIQYVYFKYKTFEVAIGYSTNVSGLIYMLKHSNNTCMYKEKIYHSRDCASDQDFIDRRLMLSVLLRTVHDPVFLLQLLFMLSFIIKIVCCLLGLKRIFPGFLMILFISLLSMQIKLLKGV